ncbi:FT-interacting protein 1-like [Iris pallida]|uniref:FT-interacting protein 1-like n=1 Tax=Iris pallida TaxID=29817 RepID=A0AAX6FCW7_IRIPA|nr:FT-interacting protein 1-like [Iris pallida]
MQAVVEVLESFNSLQLPKDDQSACYAANRQLVEQVHYLYIHVVKARNLLPVDLTGFPDPYVTVKVGNNRVSSRQIEKSRNPCWDQVFAFPKERLLLLGSDLLQVEVKDFKHKSDHGSNLIGRVEFDIAQVVACARPLAPLWYTLEDEEGEELSDVEIMLALWFGTQQDEAFPKAWPVECRPRVYFSPKLCYLRVHIVEAQDLVLSDKSRGSQTSVQVELGGQRLVTRICESQSVNPEWNEELLFVVAEPFDKPLLVTVRDQIGLKETDVLGQVVVPISSAYRHSRHQANKRGAAAGVEQWFSLSKPTSSSTSNGPRRRKGTKFFGQIHLRLFLSAGDDLLNGEIHYSDHLEFRLYGKNGDPLQPEEIKSYSSHELQMPNEQIEKPKIGTLEIGFLGAQNLTTVLTKADYKQVNNVYCVAKYGSKWVRTRTLPDTPAPRWNEQYDWEVFDPCSAITIAVYYDWKERRRDRRIGRIRIHLSSLEAGRTHVHYYSLFLLERSGARKTGELHLAIRFACTDWLNMVTTYGKPLLPRMYHVQPFSAQQMDYLRYQAMKIVSRRVEPTLRREVVEDILLGDGHMWSLRRSNAHLYRIASLFSRLAAVGRWFDRVRNWENPAATVLVHAVFLVLSNRPGLILPSSFLALSVAALWNYRHRPVDPAAVGHVAVVRRAVSP